MALLNKSPLELNDVDALSHMKENPYAYGNVAFPHYNGKDICGLELKNADKALFVRGSEKTFWRSNCKQGDDTLVIGEAVIDVVSYSILFTNETSVYAATGGGMSPEQEEILKSCFDYKIKGNLKALLRKENMLSKYSKKLNNKNNYLYMKNEILDDLREFIISQK